MIRKRPELDTKNPPGQIVNDVTLDDYYKRRGYVTKKLTFDEWYDSLPEGDWNTYEQAAYAGWRAGQENK